MKSVYIMKRSVLSICMVLGLQGIHAQVTLLNNQNGFPLVSSKSQAVICYDGTEPNLMGKVSQLFANDVQKVTGKKIQVIDVNQQKAKSPVAVLVGTISGKMAKGWISKAKIDTAGLTGAWERYRIQEVKNPMAGINRAIVVLGSDRRGAAYGLLSLSKAIGVNPWYFWLDAPIVQRSQVSLNVKGYTSKTPSVKYRGIFLNDEDWGLYPWVKLTNEKERGNFGPKTYGQICELLLRLNANYLCPAMHNCSLAFYQVNENKLVADSFGIVMGTSHCEPLFLNTATEWDKKKYGEWDYTTNRHGVDSVLKARAMQTAPYEGVYTLALRGLHDVAMNGSNDLNERKDVMQDALMAQRQIVTDAVGKPATDIPQAFTPYKEVLDVYDKGLKLPDDVTIIWPDDNYGYLKRLSSPAEQKRSGRSGVYYHASYLGRPHNYLWMNTTSPTFMYEELRKAYDCTADRIWLLNAGDIKLCEYAVDYFLSLAYDINAFNYERTARYRTEWTCNMLGKQYEKQFDDIFYSFYNLAFQRKPEEMGFGSQWTNDTSGREINVDTEFSFANYQEAERRISEYTRIGTMVEKMFHALPSSQKPCFYESVYYPVKGSELMNKAILLAQRNRWYSLQNRSASADLAKSALQSYDSLEVITKYYNTMLDGKWNHIVTVKQERTSAYFEKPELREAKLDTKASMGLFVEENDVLRGASSYYQFPAFNKFLPKIYFMDVFNKGSQSFKWQAKPSDSWIKLTKTAGMVNKEERIMVSIDWNQVPVGDRVAGNIEVTAENGQKETVLLSVFNPAMPSVRELDSTFVENNGYISIPASDFNRKQENSDIQISVIPNLGCEGTSVQFGNPVANQWYTNRKSAAFVEYDFYCFSQGPVDIYTYVLPTFTLNNDRGYAGHERTNIETHYGITIDNSRILEASTSSFEYAQNWYDSVMRNCRINKTTLNVMKPGLHRLRIIGGDAGTVLQKIVVDFGGMKRSYMGPQSTKVVL